MPSVNKCIFIGNVTRDPEVRYMPNGEAVCNFSIACNDSWKDKNGVKQERVEYINIVMYRRLAEIAGEYLKKGSQVYLEGRLQTRKWQDKTSGQDRYTTEVIADQMQMLGGKSADGAQSRPTGGSAEDYGKASGGARPAAAPQKQRPQNFDDFEDDIPF